MTVQRNHIVLGCCCVWCGCPRDTCLRTDQMNEIPAPAGKEALARSYPAGVPD